MTTLTIVSTLLWSLLALLVGFALGTWLTKRSANRAAHDRALAQRQELQLSVQQAKLDAEADSREVREELAAALSRSEGLERQIAHLYESARETQEREAQSQTLMRQMAPMKDSLTKLERSIQEIEQQRSNQHGEITEQLRTAQLSEEKLRGTAESLAAALQSGNTRGQWGEMQLRRVVEASGMVANLDFFEQAEFQGSDRKVRPDLVINLPGKKYLAVDAKVPFAKFLESQQFAGDDDASLAQKNALLKEHAKTLRKHVTALAERDYPAALGTSPQLVIAFVPSESLLAQALETDPGILEFAYSQGVALTSPTTLWAVLKAVAHTWQQEALSGEAQKLFSYSRELHKRLSTAAAHLDRLGASITQNVKHYNAFVGSIERNVLSSARKISELNSDELVQTPRTVDENIRPITAPELTAPELTVPEHTEPEPAVSEHLPPKQTALSEPSQENTDPHQDENI